MRTIAHTCLALVPYSSNVLLCRNFICMPQNIMNLFPTEKVKPDTLFILSVKVEE